MAQTQTVVWQATRAWIALTGAVAIGAGIQAFVDDQYPARLLYSNVSSRVLPTPAVTSLVGRLYAAWMLVAGTTRCIGAWALHVAAVRWILLVTYAVALVHFATEVFWFRSAPLFPAGYMPLVVASVSVLLLLLVAERIARREPVAGDDRKTGVYAVGGAARGSAARARLHAE
ncbi:hypothetical protein CDCA_CDCA08G2513 [Cyanidium caldarium]|uniref:Ergosterol biosynthetic protein 28 n=1 Tax=Cyanidium caldarium TaxID=2771 RepID=A0AAV9IW26_CYACA|nr:hypothetical protein CDCA_CDCA08G2513 [Cyanidium caldarium]